MVGPPAARASMRPARPTVEDQKGDDAEPKIPSYNGHDSESGDADKADNARDIQASVLTEPETTATSARSVRHRRIDGEHIKDQQPKIDSPDIEQQFGRIGIGSSSGRCLMPARGRRVSGTKRPHSPTDRRRCSKFGARALGRPDVGDASRTARGRIVSA